MVATYLLPLLVGVAVTDDVYGEWSVGYYGHVAQQVGGPVLAAAVTFAAAVSQVGMFEAEMSSDSYQVRPRCAPIALVPTPAGLPPAPCIPNGMTCSPWMRKPAPVHLAIVPELGSCERCLAASACAAVGVCIAARVQPRLCVTFACML